MAIDLYLSPFELSNLPQILCPQPIQNTQIMLACNSTSFFFLYSQNEVSNVKP